MLYEFKDELGGDFVYWSNCTGDLHHNCEYWIDNVEELPSELQKAYNELWSEEYWVNCYIVEFNGKYGVALEAEYDKHFAEDEGVSYGALLNIAKNKAAECADKYQDYDVIFGKDTREWSDGSINSIVSIIVPWDTSVEKFEEVAEWFDSMCYDMGNMKNLKAVEELLRACKTKEGIEDFDNHVTAHMAYIQGIIDTSYTLLGVEWDVIKEIDKRTTLEAIENGKL